MESNDSYVVRYKNGSLSRTGSAKEVFEGLQKLLPVDIIYHVVPHPDGKGYELREVGSIVVDFSPTTDSPTVAVRPTPLQPPTPPAPSIAVVESGPQEPEYVNPTDPMAYSFTEDTPPARSQEEIAKEKGVDQPKDDMMTQSSYPKNMSKMSGKITKKPLKKKGKSKKQLTAEQLADQCSNDPHDTSWLKGVPAPVRTSSPGRASVTSVRQATPEEAAAASHFGKGF